MEPDCSNILCTFSDLFQEFFGFFIFFLLLDLLLTIIRAAITNADFSDEFVDGSKEDRRAMVSYFAATAENIPVLLFALNLTHIITALFSMLLLMSLLQPWLTVVLLFLLVLMVPILLLLLGAIANGIGSRFANQLAPGLLGVARVIVAIFRPLYSLYRSFQPKSERKKIVFDQIESNLLEWVENAPAPSKLKEEERKMVRSILHFSDTLIREIMIPRVDLTAIELNTSLSDAATVILESGHSRLPVYDDEIDNIVGILYAKDLIKYYNEHLNDDYTLRSLIREPVFVPEAKKAGDLLTEMQMAGIHMVIVVDEYGGTAGIVSMEDIVEEIVGEIRDEYDEMEEVPIEKISDDEYIFIGRVDITDVNDHLHTHLSRDSADTIAGLIYTNVGKVPNGDEVITIEDWDFTILELTGNRIRRIAAKRRVNPGPTEQAEEKDGSESAD